MFSSNAVMRPNTLCVPRQAKLRQRGQCLAHKEVDRPACSSSTAMSQCNACLTEKYYAFHNAHFSIDKIKSNLKLLNIHLFHFSPRDHILSVAVNICIHYFQGEKTSPLCLGLEKSRSREKS